MNELDFKRLQDYYRQCFELVDVFHFNSNVAKTQFEKVLGKRFSQVIPITHLGINDNRIVRSFNSEKLRIGFIGTEAPYKGLSLLKHVLSRIDCDKWRLDVWGGRIAIEKDCPVYYRGKFNQSNVADVYKEMDVLVVPSIWKETFSLVTLEALSYGVPVLVSSNVGAQDLVRKYNPSFVYETQNELFVKLDDLVKDRTELRLYNKLILEKTWQHDMLNHTQNLIEKIYKD